MISYYMPYFQDGMIHSCDNLRLSFECSEHGLPSLIYYLNSIPEVQYYQSFKDYSYKHLFVFGMKGLSFSIGLSLNGNSKADVYKGFVDVNPNKILGSVTFAGGFIRVEEATPFNDSEDDACFCFFLRRQLAALFGDIMRQLKLCCLSASVKRFDFAVDVPFSRDEVQLLKDQRNYYLFSRSALDFTEYLGQADAGGRVKVYNKQIESELDYPLTRIEITCDSFDYQRFSSKWPKVYLKNLVDFENDSLTVKLLRRLPANEFQEYYQTLSRNTRKKYQGILFETPFTIPELAFQAVISVLKEFEL